MNIIMVTNTYTPIVGGVERSICSFTKYYRKKGHRVIIITLEYDNAPAKEEGVIRLPAIRHFNGSDFSIRMPIPVSLSHVLNNFEPDIVHSHHPFILGDTALRLAKAYQKPLVFTYHTRYEHYTHYVPLDSPFIKKFVIELAAGYSQLSDCVIAPSLGIKKMLEEEKVKTRIELIPTGVDIKKFSTGDGLYFRRARKIPADGLVLGCVSRLAKEKNLQFLTEAVTEFMRQNEKTYFLLIGHGPELEKIQELIKTKGLQKRFIYAGELLGQELINAYHAMDAFVFSSKSETQGVVLMEAMAASLPVIALNGPGTEDVVINLKNGCLFDKEDIGLFVQTIKNYFNLSQQEQDRLKQNANQTAAYFSIDNMAEKALSVYQSLLKNEKTQGDIEDSHWARTVGRLKAEWELFTNMTDAMGEIIKEKGKGKKGKGVERRPQP